MKKKKAEFTQVKTRIKQGRLSLVKIAPKHFIEFIEQLKQEHSDKIPYVISRIQEKGFHYFLITFRKESITRLAEKFNLSVSHFKYPHFYIEKKRYGGLIKQNKRLLITVFPEDELPNDFKLIFSLNSNYITQFLPELHQSSKTEIIEALSSIKRDNVKKLAKIKPINTFLSKIPIEDYDLSIKPMTDGYEITLSKKRIRFELNEEDYDQFLLNSGKVKSIDEINSMKNIENMKGSARYFANYLKSFINHIRADTANKTFQSIINEFKDVNLEEFNFEKIEKRAFFYADVYVSFSPNNDVIISKTETMRFDTDNPLKLIEENIRAIITAKYAKFERKPFSEEILDFLLDFSMKTVRFGLDVYYEPDFLDDYFYYTNSFSKFLETFIIKFKLKGNKIHFIPITIAYFNALSVHFPKKIAKSSLMDFLIKNVLDLTNLEKKGVISLFQYSRMFSLLYLVAQDLDFLTKKLIEMLFLDKIKDLLSSFRKQFSIKSEPRLDIEVIERQINRKISSIRSKDQIDQLLEFIEKKISHLNKIDSDQLKLFLKKIREILEETVFYVDKLDIASKNAGKIIKINITQLNARHDIIAGGGLMLILIAMDMSKKVRPYQISTLLGIDTTTLPRQIKKFVSLDGKDSTEFDSLEISSKFFINKAKRVVINQLVNVFVLSLIKFIKKGRKFYKLIDDLEERLKFVKEELAFPDKFDLIEEYLEKLIKLLPNEIKKKIEQFHPKIKR